MDIERLFNTTIRYMYEDYDHKQDSLHKQFNSDSITYKVYQERSAAVIREHRDRIVNTWKNLSPEDQITFYIGFFDQDMLVPCLTHEQASAIILIQDQLIVSP